MSPVSRRSLDPLLKALVKHNGSDLHLKVGAPPRIRISGSLVPLKVPPPTDAECEQWVLQSMDEQSRARFQATNEADYAIMIPEVGRFRANAYRTRGRVGMVARLVAAHPKPLAALGMPAVISRLALEPRGLVLVTGPTGSGKTTTLAGMVDEINAKRSVHIITIEDPIEIMHEDNQSSVSQRELGTDTNDWASALRAAMRQDPNVILIGEMRDVETARIAVHAAQSGHLVMSTLHTTDAAETVNRIIDFFLPHEQKQVRLSLAQSLKGVVCQRLVPRADGNGRVCALEILNVSDRVAEAIADPAKTSTIPTLIAEGANPYGMQTFDQHLLRLVCDGLVSVTDAKAAASRPNDLMLQLKRAGIDPATIDAA